MRIYISLMLLFIMAPFVYSQTIAMTPVGRVGTADLIVVGTVETVIEPSRDTVGSAVIIVNKTMKGPLEDRITISNIAWMVPAHPKRLAPGQKHLFFLQKYRGGYILANGPLGILQASDVELYKQTIDDFPLIISLVPHHDPYYYTGQETTVTVKVKNISQEPIGIVAVVLRGFYHSPVLPGNIEGDVKQDKFNTEEKEPKITIIKPGEESDVAVRVVFYPPAAWKDVSRESYLQTAIALRACVLVDLTLPHKDIFHTYYAYSPLVTTLVGFPPPTIK